MTLGGPTPFRRPLSDLSPPISTRPLKVSKTLESEAIFQHKSHAMLAYVEDCLQVAAKMAQDRNMGPTWLHLGLIFLAKMSISRGSGGIFKHFGELLFKMSKTPPR